QLPGGRHQDDAACQPDRHDGRRARGARRLDRPGGTRAMSDAPLFSLKSRRVLLPGAPEPVPAVVTVGGGRIAAVAPGASAPEGVPVEDLGDLVLLPGAVDTHAHINEPGRTDWEGFAT